MHSDFKKMLCLAVCFINSIAALHLGFMAFGYNILNMGFLANLATPLAYLFGISGTLGLVMWFMQIFYCKCYTSGCAPR